VQEDVLSVMDAVVCIPNVFDSSFGKIHSLPLDPAPKSTTSVVGSSSSSTSISLQAVIEENAETW
jgi:hypothetical protein